MSLLLDLQHLASEPGELSPALTLTLVRVLTLPSIRRPTASPGVGRGRLTLARTLTQTQA